MWSTISLAPPVAALRRVRAMAYFALSCLALAACGDDLPADATAAEPLRPFANVELALRCDRTGGCTPGNLDMCGASGATSCLREDGRRVDLAGFDRVPPTLSPPDFPLPATLPPPTVACELGEDALRFTIEARQGGSTLFVGREGGACSVVVVTVDGSVFQGACSDQPPTPDQPCQLVSLSPRVGVGGGLSLEGGLFCQGMRAVGGPADVELEITAQGDDTYATGGPGWLVVSNCEAVGPPLPR